MTTLHPTAPRGTPEFLDDTHLRLGSTDFYCSFHSPGSDEQLHLMKPRPMVEQYLELPEALGGLTDRVMELGIFRGGSTPFLAELLQPRRLVSIEISPKPVKALSDFIAARSLDDVVHPHYGVDQSDRSRLAAILDQEFGGEPLDLVIDDASHAYGPTVASFEAIFPRLRPGGLYVIEDWHSLHRVADLITAYVNDPAHDPEVVRQLEAKRDRSVGTSPETPLTQLALELVLARASAGDLVDWVKVDDSWVTVRRGPAELDPVDFRLRHLYQDHFGQLALG